MWDVEAIYRSHVDSVFRYALRLTGNRVMAEDLTSEAFLALLRHRESVTEEKLPAWLFTVAKNRALDLWRHRSTEEKYCERSLREEAGSESAPDALSPDLLDHKALKPVHRVCLILRYVHGMTRTEIAQHTGLSETQVKGHLQYSLEILRRELRTRSFAG